MKITLDNAPKPLKNNHLHHYLGARTVLIEAMEHLMRAYSVLDELKNRSIKDSGSAEVLYQHSAQRLEEVAIEITKGKVEQGTGQLADMLITYLRHEKPSGNKTKR